jgi:predicted adenine nucleotide alpha hydrolase (AANH) superfamily ATPase
LNLLLHICCAPCAMGVIKRLNSERIKYTGFCYNPNIHPEDEYRKRYDSVISLSKDESFEVISNNDLMLEYWKEKLEPEKNKRCGVCYALRLEKTARTAKEKGFDAFTTTLLVSPWQDHEKIIEIAETCSKKYGVYFLYMDFRPYYREGKNEAYKRGYYLQKYCGCVYSYNESDHKKKPVYKF